MIIITIIIIIIIAIIIYLNVILYLYNAKCLLLSFTCIWRSSQQKISGPAVSLTLPPRVLQKAVIVSPRSVCSAWVANVPITTTFLMENWVGEFLRWLDFGQERPSALDGRQILHAAARAISCQQLIIGTDGRYIPSEEQCPSVPSLGLHCGMSTYR